MDSFAFQFSARAHDDACPTEASETESLTFFNSSYLMHLFARTGLLPLGSNLFLPLRVAAGFFYRLSLSVQQIARRPRY